LSRCRGTCPAWTEALEGLVVVIAELDRFSRPSAVRQFL